MAKSTGEDWFGAPGAARYISVALRTIYKLVDQGDVPAYEVGRVFRIRRSNLDDFLERRRVEPGELAHLYPLDHEEPDEGDEG